MYVVETVWLLLGALYLCNNIMILSWFSTVVGVVHSTGVVESVGVVVGTLTLCNSNVILFWFSTVVGVVDSVSWCCCLGHLLCVTVT